MKFLIAGLGGIGQRHLRNLRLQFGASAEIIAYRVRGRTEVLTERFEIEQGSSLEQKFDCRSFASLDDALAQKPDAVFICNPSSLHVPVALAAAEAGCHLFIEKPLSHDSTNVKELIAAVERQSLTALVGYQMRFHPVLRRLRELLRMGAVGRVISVNVEVGEYLPGFHPYEDYRTMYASRSELGGGVVLSQIHELDYLYWLFNTPRRVFAVGGTLSNLGVDVEDVASVLMEFEVEGRAIPVQLHQDYVQRPSSRTCKVIGDAGKIIADFTQPSLCVFDGEGKLTETVWTEFDRNQLFLDELSHFLASIEGQEEPLVTLSDGAQSLRMALAIKESMKSGKVVELA